MYTSFQSFSFKVSSIFWRSLSIIFLFLSFDELLRIHEKIGNFTGNYIDGKGVFNFEWLIPYGILLVILIFIYTKSLFLLPKGVRNNMIISAVLFIGGAVGIEMITGLFIDENNLNTVEQLSNSTTILSYIL